MDKPTLVGDRTVAAHKDVFCDRLPEDLDFEHICDDLFCLSIDIGMHESNVIVARDDIAERRQTFLHPLDRHGVGERVTEMLQFLVGCSGRDEQAVPVS